MQFSKYLVNAPIYGIFQNCYRYELFIWIKSFTSMFSHKSFIKGHDIFSKLVPLTKVSQMSNKKPFESWRMTYDRYSPMEIIRKKYNTRINGNNLDKLQQHQNRIFENNYSLWKKHHLTSHYFDSTLLNFSRAIAAIKANFGHIIVVSVYFIGLHSRCFGSYLQYLLAIWAQKLMK